MAARLSQVLVLLVWLFVSQEGQEPGHQSSAQLAGLHWSGFWAGTSPGSRRAGVKSCLNAVTRAVAPPGEGGI